MELGAIEMLSMIGLRGCHYKISPEPLRDDPRRQPRCILVDRQQYNLSYYLWKEWYVLEK